MKLKTLKDLRDFVESSKNLPEDYLLVIGVSVLRGTRTIADYQKVNQYVLSVEVVESYGDNEVVLLEGSGDTFWK